VAGASRSAQWKSIKRDYRNQSDVGGYKSCQKNQTGSLASARVIALCAFVKKTRLMVFWKGSLGCSLMHSLRGMDVNAGYGCVYPPTQNQTETKQRERGEDI
jgi:hypothetical protein